MGLSAALSLLTLLLALFFGLLLWQWPAAYGYVLMEDTPPEWLGCLMLLVSAWLYASGLRNRIRARQLAGALFCAGMVLLAFFVAGEEISWGQRILAFKPPDYFVRHNIQRELTVHNLTLPWMRPRRLAFVFMAGYGVMLPALVLISGSFRRLMQTCGIPVPPLGSSLGFCVAGLLMMSPVTGTDDELGELFFAVAIGGSAVLAAGYEERRGGRVLLQTFSILVVVSFIASLLSFHSATERQHLLDVGPLQAGLAYEGRGMPLHAAAEYEKLAQYWGTDWSLWVRVIELYYRGGDLERAYWLASGFLRIHRRERAVYGILVEIAHRWGIHDDVRAQIEEVLSEEPENSFAQEALSLVERLAREYRQWP